MNLSQQKVTIVGTDAQQKRLVKGKMVRFRADPLTMLELDEIRKKTNLDMSATIRHVIHTYKEIDLSVEVLRTWRNLRQAEIDFKASIETKENQSKG